MKLYIFILYNIISCSGILLAQNNALYLEALGNTGYISLGYERKIKMYNKFKFTYDIGFSTYRLLDYRKKINPDITIPFLLKSYYYWRPKHALFFGSGIMWSSFIDVNYDNKIDRNNTFYWNTNIGYSIECSKKIQLQVYYISLVSSYWDHWVGLKIAYKW